MSFSPGTYSEGGIQAYASDQKCQTIPAPTKILCCRQLPALAFSCSTPTRRLALPRQAITPYEPHIESHTSLHYKGSSSGLARVCPPKLTRGTFTEMAESALKTGRRRRTRRSVCSTLFIRQYWRCAGPITLGPVLRCWRSASQFQIRALC